MKDVAYVIWRQKFRDDAEWREVRVGPLPLASAEAVAEEARSQHGIIDVEIEPA